MTMFCHNCGIEVEEDAKFCPKCGIKLNESKKTENVFNSPDDGIKSKGVLSFLDDWNEWDTSKKIGSIILACCIGLIIMGAIGSIVSPDVNTSSSDYDTYPSDYEQRYDSYSSSSSSSSSSDEVNNVEVDKMELTPEQYAYLAYDGTKDYTINGQKGYLFVGPYHDGGSDVDFYYQDGGKYYMLSACDDADKAIDKMKQMV